MDIYTKFNCKRLMSSVPVDNNYYMHRISNFLTLLLVLLTIGLGMISFDTTYLQCIDTPCRDSLLNTVLHHPIAGYIQLRTSGVG